MTIKNIHIRYEDKISVPGVGSFIHCVCWTHIRDRQHPFAAGVTLASFNAVSVNEKWEPAFIESTAGAIHKVRGLSTLGSVELNTFQLANLVSLAVYFDTDSQSVAGLPIGAAKEKFSAMVRGSLLHTHYTHYE